MYVCTVLLLLEFDRWGYSQPLMYLLCFAFLSEFSMKGIKAFTRHIRRRDPAERLLRYQWQSVERFKRMGYFWVGCLLLFGSLTIEQWNDPSIVKLPILDGRSLVT